MLIALYALLVLVATRIQSAVESKSLDGTSGVESFDLPTALPISRIWLDHEATFGTAEDITHNRVDIIAGGESPIMGNLEGSFARGVSKFWTGREPFRTAAAATTFESWLYFQFGRAPADRRAFLPAPKFSSLKLRLDWQVSAATNSNDVNIWVEQLRDVDPNQGFMKRLKRLDTFDPTSVPLRTTEIEGGSDVRLGAVYIDDDGDDDNLDDGDIELEYLDGQREIFVGPLDQLRQQARMYYNFHDDARPTDLNAIPVDKVGGVANATRLGQNPELTTRADTANASGTVRTYAETYVPLDRS